MKTALGDHLRKPFQESSGGASLVEPQNWQLASGSSDRLGRPEEGEAGVFASEEGFLIGGFRSSVRETLGAKPLTRSDKR